MSYINNQLNATDFSEQLRKGGGNYVKNNVNAPLNMLESEISKQIDISETIESMSIIRRRVSAKGTGEDKVNDVIDLINLAEDLDIPNKFVQKIDSLLELSDSHFESYLTNLNRGDAISCLTAMIYLSRNNKKKYSKYLLSMLENEEHWEVEIFSHLKLNGPDSRVVERLKNIYQYSLDNKEKDESMLGWFKRVKDYPDREVYLQIILSALIFELNKKNSISDKIKVSSLISDLYRIISFFSFSYFCNSVSSSYSIKDVFFMEEIILILDCPWVNNEWLYDSYTRLNIDENLKVKYFLSLRSLFYHMPSICFAHNNGKEDVLVCIDDIIDDY
ncbi:hypothetical protein FNN75_12545 [Salmonella enterica subsp. arizonae]|nr:hypothetical protein [Salmonella enterica]ECJ2545638.1 hypothetical protein [Salmonella enterica subsp. arizonae]EEU6243846.1 hypothetical protein [Salmonella enterica]EGH5015777.1 hypothetical protein [Salmonella enterica]EHM5449655.1 hypothetical protein [Salmonella enterica]